VRHDERGIPEVGPQREKYHPPVRRQMVGQVTWRPGRLLRLFFTGFAAVMAVLALAPDGDILVAQGIVFRRVTPVAAVVDAYTTRDGLCLEYDDDRSFVVTLVGEKGLLLELIGRRTTGDAISEQVRTAATKARTDREP
jgi:hypothetical protein